MNIRQAIFAAADHVEQYPADFNFNIGTTDCGSPGCALGWISHFTGAGRYYECLPLMGLRDTTCRSEIEFYGRMNELAAGWKYSAVTCARALRLYADKYHPAESRALIPASVRAIFEMTPAELAREFVAEHS